MYTSPQDAPPDMNEDQHNNPYSEIQIMAIHKNIVHSLVVLDSDRCDNVAASFMYYSLAITINYEYTDSCINHELIVISSHTLHVSIASVSDDMSVAV